MNNLKLPNWGKAALLGTAILLSGVGIGFGITHFQTTNAGPGTASLRAPDKAYKLISPLLVSGDAQSENSKEVTDIRNEIDKENTATAVSVYFKDLNAGKWFFIDNEKFSPASLSKVPLMIAYYKLAESQPAILGHTLITDIPDFNYKESLNSPNSIKTG